ncbi:MAG: adenylyl-sulfate kinase, partial [Bdellovibrio sp.]
MAAKVIWLTGLSGSGKSTIAKALKAKLEEQGNEVKILDGDELRRTISADLGFSPEDREKHNMRVIELANQLKNEGIYVL